jgi:membrane-associated phospholipid phosphatase
MILSQLRQIFSNVGQHAGWKLVCHATVGAWIALFYYGPQLRPLFPAHAAPTLAMDHWVPFQPSWALVYQSVFIVHTLALWLPSERESVNRYALTLAGVFVAGAVVFWLYPTLSPRPENPGSALHIWFISTIDGPRNAFPSLHAAMGLLAARAVCIHLRECPVSRGWRIAVALWWVVLLYSTLATRQHRILDLVAGLLLAVAALSLPVFIKQKSRRHDPVQVSPHQPALQ